MKLFNVVLMASTLVLSAVPGALAGSKGIDSPTYRAQMENLWIATGDPTFARLAGLTPGQIAAEQTTPYDRADR